LLGYEVTKPEIPPCGWHEPSRHSAMAKFKAAYLQIVRAGIGRELVADDKPADDKRTAAERERDAMEPERRRAVETFMSEYGIPLEAALEMFRAPRADGG
jgi:hypothetical protein